MVGQPNLTLCLPTPTPWGHTHMTMQMMLYWNRHHNSKFLTKVPGKLLLNSEFLPGNLGWSPQIRISLYSASDINISISVCSISSKQLILILRTYVKVTGKLETIPADFRQEDTLDRSPTYHKVPGFSWDFGHTPFLLALIYCY